MAAPHTQADYLAALQALLPRGAAWPKDSEAVQTALMEGFAASFAEEDLAALSLLSDAFPATAAALLAEWEATLGLPDPCEGPAPTLQQRRAQVATKFAGEGGQSPAYLLRVAEGLGYTGVTLQEYAPFRAGVDAAERPVFDETWAYAFLITSPDYRAFYFSADVSTAGEALLTVVNDVIVCVIDRLKPSHTLALYAGLVS